jgi:hypothetical protein
MMVGQHKTDLSVVQLASHVGIGIRLIPQIWFAYIGYKEF